MVLLPLWIGIWVAHEVSCSPNYATVFDSREIENFSPVVAVT